MNELERLRAFKGVGVIRQGNLTGTELGPVEDVIVPLPLWEKLLAVVEAAQQLDLRELASGLDWMVSEVNSADPDYESLDRLEAALAALESAPGVAQPEQSEEA